MIVVMSVYGRQYMTSKLGDHIRIMNTKGETSIDAEVIYTSGISSKIVKLELIRKLSTHRDQFLKKRRRKFSKRTVGFKNIEYLYKVASF